MEDLINSVDDATAIRVVQIVAKNVTQGSQPELTPGLRQLLQDKYGVKPEADRASDGDLARQVLLVFAQDSRMRGPITALIEETTPQSFGRAGNLAMITAALIALQIHVHIERDAKGEVSVLVDKPSASEKLLKPLAQKLISR
jgi:hypothetical protein